MLRVTEEILLLILDSGSGSIQHSLPERQRDVVLAGAVLTDLALENRIDTDPERLFLVDTKSVGDDLLDPTLQEIAGEAETHDTAYWIMRTAHRGSAIRATASARLIAHGILEPEANGLLFLSRLVARARRYPTVGGATLEDVQSRVMRTLFSEDIPEPRDVLIIGLAAACGVFESILSREELADVQQRIDSISRLDLMGRTIRESIRTLEPAAPAAKSVRPPEEIPAVAGLPVAGNAIPMAGDVREFLARSYRQYGPIFRIRAFGFRCIALAGPEANVLLARISGTHVRSYEAYREFAPPMGGHRIMLNMDGPEHLRMRKLQINGFSPRTIESQLGAVHGLTQRLIGAWPQGQPVEVQRAMQGIIAEQIGLCCTGVSPGPYIDDLVRFLGMIITVYIQKRLPSQVESLPKYRRAKRRVRELYDKVMEAHKAEGRDPGQRDYVDQLLDANRTDPQFLPETDLLANIIAPYLAGIDTAASVCSFMLYAILKHPDLLERMRAEVGDLYASGPPTPEGLRKLEVTHRIALETLRMYPIIPVITRTVSNSFDFAGYRVPAGAEIMIGTTVGHHLPKYFPDPERFDIERYSRSEAQHRQPGAFAPFGVGRHKCLGAGFTEVQIALTLATIVHETDLVLDRPERPLKVKAAPVPHPHGLRVRVVRRRGA